MARERPLEPTVVWTWLAMWEQRDPFCDDAIRHLQTLIQDNKCYVVITVGIGREPRSLVFRRWKHVLPLARNIAEQKAELLEYDFYKMLVSPEAPTARNDRQFWHQTGANGCTRPPLPRAQKVFQWNGADWMLYGYVRDDPIISKQGKQNCGFMEALACSHELARWSKGFQIIYTFDNSTWGNA